MTEQASIRFCQGCNDTVAGTEACISKPKSMDAALDMIRWCQHTRKAVSAIQKPGKPELTTEKSSNSPVVLGVGSTKSSLDNRLSRMEEYMEKMMSTVTSLVQEKSARQELSPTSRSPNQDNRSSNYSPRRNYGRGRGCRNNSTDRRLNGRGYDTGECFYCHKQGHYKRNCPDLWRNNNRQQTKQLTPKKNTQDERRVEFDDDNLVHDEQEKTSAGDTSVETLHVAPIDCNMLIGADFLIKHGAILDVPPKKMNLRNTQVNLKLGGETTTSNSPIVNRVTVQHTMIVPPNSALRIDLESADMATDYLIEP
ncbi:unnamed protein product [Mytilus edulis]|uniref:CCHC-type domain-containing protein n=1 Tax=Mytilus edulis TaxID=6550 RepID=A0A8S3RU25_MYTED|nr:unnamed protein product [Mytilus edulis]